MARSVLSVLLGGACSVGLVAVVGVGSVTAATTIQDDLCQRVRARVVAEASNVEVACDGRDVDLTMYDSSRTWVPALAAVAKVRDVDDISWQIVIRADPDRVEKDDEAAPRTREPRWPVTLRFTGGRAALTTSGRGRLRTVARYLRENSGVRVKATGYTDNGLDAEARTSLGLLRAVSVLRFLNDHGVPAGAVAIESRGARNPVASNRTAAGRAENRRVEIVLVDKGES